MGRSPYSPHREGRMMTFDELLLQYEKLKSTASQMLMFIGMSATLKTPVDIDIYKSFGKDLKELGVIENGDIND